MKDPFIFGKLLFGSGSIPSQGKRLALDQLQIRGVNLEGNQPDPLGVITAKGADFFPILQVFFLHNQAIGI
jgi:hypothetical protein